MGLNDHADPNMTNLLGDTPGPLGLNDHAEPNLRSFAQLSMPQAAGMCLAEDGQALSLGFTPFVTSFAPPAGSINLDLAQEMALKITTFFEGGKSMNYQALAGDFDGQGTSFGLIQWNFGQNTLGPLLKKMIAADATSFGSKTVTGL